MNYSFPKRLYKEERNTERTTCAICYSRIHVPSSLSKHLPHRLGLRWSDSVGEDDVDFDMKVSLLLGGSLAADGHALFDERERERSA